MSDEDILALGGTQEDIDAYAHDVGGACGAAYGGTCDHCGKSDTSKDDEDLKQEISDAIDKHVNGCDIAYSSKEDQQNQLAVVKAVLPLIKQYGIKQRIDELDKLPRTGWISNGIRYDVILFTQIDNRKLELMKLKDKQEDK